MVLTCSECSSPFAPTVHNQRRCSHRCTRRAAKHRETVRRRGFELPASRSCDECGAAFRPFSYRSRYCSPLCRNRAKDHARAERWRIKRGAIFERDAWTCQLCLDPIDPARRFPDPMSATVDHIDPVSLGGSDDPANLQAAHMRCNSAKGNAA